MAIFIEGMTCHFCGQPMRRDSDRISFSPFVVSQLDPLWVFSDGSFHAECVRGHPLGNQAVGVEKAVGFKQL
ncbi:MAG: hypothetical protein Q7S40_25925 [Opitutaceae bacterium]|nr:hypothetical protein [Opitutaceae bacterium]